MSAIVVGMYLRKLDFDYAQPTGWKQGVQIVLQLLGLVSEIVCLTRWLSGVIGFNLRDFVSNPLAARSRSQIIQRTSILP